MSRSKAEAAAVETLKRYGIAASPPIDVASIATEAGAELIYEPLDGDVSASLIRFRGGETVIAVNSWHPLNRQRFSIAHELGHLFLHVEENNEQVFLDKPFQVLFRDRLSSLAIDGREMEANAFAAEILMPGEAVVRQIAGALKRQPQIAPSNLAGRLARNFSVSTQAMHYRLINLGLVEPD